MDLFSYRESANPMHMPLAEKMRPTTLEDFVEPSQQSGPWRLIKIALQGEGLIPNLLFWGPPGTGKTTLARLLAQKTNAYFVAINSIDTGAKELRRLGEEARQRKMESGQITILFIDEIHRLNKSQQDMLLPFSERGDYIFIGATTENPSYELNSALLSRCQVILFSRLKDEQLQRVLGRAFTRLQIKVEQWFTPEAVTQLIHMADGDARRLLTALEAILALHLTPPETPLSADVVKETLAQPTWGYQATGEDHYNCISAFIKSVRGSDPDAAVYYLARMLEGQEDPIFLARRLVILASEDIGNADPKALPLAVAGLQAVELVGLPEAAINLSQVTTYLASAPKSNAAYMALNKAREAFKKTGRVDIPLALRSDRTPLAKKMGYGKDYKYSHNSPRGYIPQRFLPEALGDEKFYEPKNIGYEKQIIDYLTWLKKVDP